MWKTINWLYFKYNNNNNADLIKENDDKKINTSDSESEDLDEVDINKNDLCKTNNKTILKRSLSY